VAFEELADVYVWAASLGAVRTSPEYVPAVRAFVDALVDLAAEDRMDSAYGRVAGLRAGKRYGWLSPADSLHRRPIEIADRHLFVVTCEVAPTLVADIGSLDEALAPEFWRLALDEVVISREEREFLVETLNATRSASNKIKSAAARSILEELPPKLLRELASFFASRIDAYIASIHPIAEHEGRQGEWEVLFPPDAIREIRPFREQLS